MNKVFKKDKCRYTSTGLSKRFDLNKWNHRWNEKEKVVLQSLTDPDYNKMFLSNWVLDSVELEAEECLLNFYKETDHLTGHGYILEYGTFIKDMRDKYGDELVKRVRKSLSKKHW